MQNAQTQHGHHFCHHELLTVAIFRFQGFVNVAGAIPLMQSPSGEPDHGAPKNLARATSWDRVVAETLLEVATAHGRPLSAIQTANQAGTAQLQSAFMRPTSAHAAGHRPFKAAAGQTGHLLPSPVVAALQNGSNEIGQAAVDAPPALLHLYKAGAAEPQPSGFSSSGNVMHHAGDRVHQGPTTPSSQNELHQQLLPKATEHGHADADAQTATVTEGPQILPAADSFPDAARQAAELTDSSESALPAAHEQGTAAPQSWQLKGVGPTSAVEASVGSQISKSLQASGATVSQDPSAPGPTAAGEAGKEDSPQPADFDASRADVEAAAGAAGLHASLQGSSSHDPAEGQASASI